jgi:hypothetical protein
MAEREITFEPRHQKLIRNRPLRGVRHQLPDALENLAASLDTVNHEAVRPFLDKRRKKDLEEADAALKLDRDLTAAELVQSNPDLRYVGGYVQRLEHDRDGVAAGERFKIHWREIERNSPLQGDPTALDEAFEAERQAFAAQNGLEGQRLSAFIDTTEEYGDQRVATAVLEADAAADQKADMALGDLMREAVAADDPEVPGYEGVALHIREQKAAEAFTAGDIAKQEHSIVTTLLTETEGMSTGGGIELLSSTLPEIELPSERARVRSRISQLEADQEKARLLEGSTEYRKAMRIAAEGEVTRFMLENPGQQVPTELRAKVMQWSDDPLGVDAKINKSLEGRSDAYDWAPNLRLEVELKNGLAAGTLGVFDVMAARLPQNVKDSLLTPYLSKAGAALRDNREVRAETDRLHDALAGETEWAISTYATGLGLTEAHVEELKSMWDMRLKMLYQDEPHLFQRGQEAALQFRLAQERSKILADSKAITDTLKARREARNAEREARGLPALGASDFEKAQAYQGEMYNLWGRERMARGLNTSEQADPHTIVDDRDVE